MFDVKSNFSIELMSVIVLEQFVRNSAKYCSASASSGLIGGLSRWHSCKLPLFQSQVQNTPLPLALLNIAFCWFRLSTDFRQLRLSFVLKQQLLEVTVVTCAVLNSMFNRSFKCVVF